MLRAWLKVEELYLHEITKLEGRGVVTSCQECGVAEGIIRCRDCFAEPMYCHRCCLGTHERHPFHRILRWSGGFFSETSLHDEGCVLYLGHNGGPCPVEHREDKANGIHGKTSDYEDSWEDVDPQETEDRRGSAGSPTQTLTAVDCNGVHKIRISWCSCPESLKKDMQLLHVHLFPATIVRPSTVFTFRVLEYFHIDAVECKTVAMNFFSKLR